MSAARALGRRRAKQRRRAHAALRDNVPARAAFIADVGRSPEQVVAAPASSCTRCLKGDTRTHLSLVGSAEFVIEGFRHALGLPDEGWARQHAYDVLYTEWREHDPPIDYGKVPVGELQCALRLCEACGRQAGLKLGMDEVHLEYHEELMA
jgi:hypothetical protein